MFRVFFVGCPSFAIPLKASRCGLNSNPDESNLVAISRPLVTHHHSSQAYEPQAQEADFNSMNLKLQTRKS